jgi:hypothetical protein
MRFLRAKRLHHFRERLLAMSLMDAKVQEQRALELVQSAEQNALSMQRYRQNCVNQAQINIAALHELWPVEVALHAMREVADSEYQERQEFRQLTGTQNAEQKKKLKHLQTRIDIDAQLSERQSELMTIQSVGDLINAQGRGES